MAPWGTHPHLQLLTVHELLEGKGIDYPHLVNVTLKAAAKARRSEATIFALPLDESEGAC
jgi:hypothetical protein